jgi:hypothetical protein
MDFIVNSRERAMELAKAFKDSSPGSRVKQSQWRVEIIDASGEVITIDIRKPR